MIVLLALYSFFALVIFILYFAIGGSNVERTLIESLVVSVWVGFLWPIVFVGYSIKLLFKYIKRR